MRSLRLAALMLGLLLAAGIGFAWWYDHVGQHPDQNFDTRVASRAYPPGTGARHPKVLIDEAHRNFHTASGRYGPFAELLKSDGYAVSSSQHLFTAEALKDADVLVVANAMGPGEHEGRAAFTPEEETALSELVRAR